MTGFFNVRASYERKETVSREDTQRLERKTDRARANLPEEYAWLRGWEWVGNTSQTGPTGKQKKEATEQQRL